MSHVTFPIMAKNPKKEAGETSEAPRTTSVRLDFELARKAAIIATATGKDVSEVLSPIVKPELERLFAQLVRQLSMDAQITPAKK